MPKEITEEANEELQDEIMEDTTSMEEKLEEIDYPQDADYPIGSPENHKDLKVEDIPY